MSATLTDRREQSLREWFMQTPIENRLYWIYEGGSHYAIIAPNGKTLITLPKETCKCNSQPSAPTPQQVRTLVDALNRR